MKWYGVSGMCLWKEVIFVIAIVSRSALLDFNDAGKLISLTDLNEQNFLIDWLTEVFAKSEETNDFFTVIWMLYCQRDRRRDITKLSLLYKIIFIALLNFFIICFICLKSLVRQKCCKFKIISFIHWSR